MRVYRKYNFISINRITRYRWYRRDNYTDLCKDEIMMMWNKKILTCYTYQTSTQATNCMTRHITSDVTSINQMTPEKILVQHTCILYTRNM